MDISDLPKVRGPLRYVGYIGVLIMLGGLSVFAYGLLSMFVEFDPDNMPRGFPPFAIYGFGVAFVGGILVTIALAIGPKDDAVSITTGPIHTGTGPIITNPTGTVNAPTYVINQQRIYIGQISYAIDAMPLDPATRSRANAAVSDIEGAVGRQDAPETANALGRLTQILYDVGAFATAGSVAEKAIVNLAGSLGAYGQALVHWFAGLA